MVKWAGISVTQSARRIDRSQRASFGAALRGVGTHNATSAARTRVAHAVPSPLFVAADTPDLAVFVVG